MKRWTRRGTNRFNVLRTSLLEGALRAQHFERRRPEPNVDANCGQTFGDQRTCIGHNWTPNPRPPAGGACASLSKTSSSGLRSPCSYPPQQSRDRARAVQAQTRVAPRSI